MKAFILSLMMFLLALGVQAQDTSRGVPMHMLFETDGQYYAVSGYLKDGVFTITSRPDSVYISPPQETVPKKKKRLLTAH